MFSDDLYIDVWELQCKMYILPLPPSQKKMLTDRALEANNLDRPLDTSGE